MEIKQLRHREDLVNNPKLNQAQIQFLDLIKELNNKNLQMINIFQSKYLNH